MKRRKTLPAPGRQKIALSAGWDADLLKLELKELATLDIDFDLSVTGFSTGEMGVLLTPKSDPDDETIPALAVDPRTRPGDIWICQGTPRRQGLRRGLAARGAGRTRHHGVHSLKIKSQDTGRIRPHALSPAPQNREHVRQDQGLATRSYPLRPLRPRLHVRHLHRSRRHLLVVINESEPSSATCRTASLPQIFAIERSGVVEQLLMPPEWRIAQPVTDWD
jgi:hypothetical protein